MLEREVEAAKAEEEALADERRNLQRRLKAAGGPVSFKVGSPAVEAAARKVRLFCFILVVDDIRIYLDKNAARKKRRRNRGGKEMHRGRDDRSDRWQQEREKGEGDVGKSFFVTDRDYFSDKPGLGVSSHLSAVSRKREADAITFSAMETGPLRGKAIKMEGRGTAQVTAHDARERLVVLDVTSSVMPMALAEYEEEGGDESSEDDF